MLRSLPSISDVIGKLHPSYREAILKRLKQVNSDDAALTDLEKNPSVKNAYQLLGSAVYRKSTLEWIRDRVQQGIGSSYSGWYKELKDLHDLCSKQIDFCTNLISTILQQESASNETK